VGYGSVIAATFLLVGCDVANSQYWLTTGC